VTIDQIGANLTALRAINAERETPIKTRQRKYLNNIVEQDHRAIKRRTRPMLGFKKFGCARILIKRYRTHAHDQQGTDEKLRTRAQSRPAILRLSFITNSHHISLLRPAILIATVPRNTRSTVVVLTTIHQFSMCLFHSLHPRREFVAALQITSFDTLAATGPGGHWVCGASIAR